MPTETHLSHPLYRDGAMVRAVNRLAYGTGDTILLHLLSAAIGRYCCKSPKLIGANFPIVKKSD